MTYLIIIPALIAMLVPAIGVALSRYSVSRATLDIGLFVSVLFIASYATGVVWLALRDHRRISAKGALLER
jgi:Ca2+/H+ antiporter